MKLIKKEIILFILVTILSIVLSNMIYNDFKMIILKNNSYIVEYNENDLIYTINNIDLNEANIEVLEIYGYNIPNTKEFISIKKNIYLYVFIFNYILFIIFIFFYNKEYYKNKKRIKEIDNYINEIIKGNYQLDIKDYNEEEYSILKNDIYKVTVKLREQNENLIKEKKLLEELLSNISHQIKTPLTSMYVINDILYEEKSVKKRKEFLNKNRLQLNKVEWLVKSLLKLSRLDSGVVKLEFSEVIFNDLIEDILSPLKISFELKGVNIILKGDLNSKLIIDKNWMYEALSNIIKNAYEHTKDEIVIEVNDNVLYTNILIKDNGLGISSEEMPHLFERFYKNSSKDSIGIGLNLSHKIISMHYGSIDVYNDSGTTFEIKLYKNNV